MTGIELCAPKEVTGGRDVVQSREVSKYDIVGIKPKSPQALPSKVTQLYLHRRIWTPLIGTWQSLIRIEVEFQ